MCYVYAKPFLHCIEDIQVEMRLKCDMKIASSQNQVYLMLSVEHLTSWFINHIKYALYIYIY